MPKGQKNVDWLNPINDKKLLNAIVVTSSANINYNLVAKAFGDNVPASSISLRINKIRKESRPVKITSTANKALDQASDESDLEMKSDSDESKPATHDNVKTISGRVTKPRKSPRQSSVVKKDYGKLLDPYNDLDVVDEDGDAVFARQGVTPEDSLDSDAEYTHRNDAGGQVEV
ncbi:MAG: hypothetical protein Q9186_006596 [Xanthomendoza sp. 1 TL-2023]